MYTFRDTTETLEDNVLPSEALQINGVYIEDLIPGYRTLTVSGREALSPELSSYSTGVRDGSKLKNRRFPARTITVTYQLIAESNEAFRAAYNALGSILNVEDAELIFNDEQDKYFIGTPSSIGNVEAGRNSIVGEIQFVCNDPFKYSMLEYEAEPNLDDSSILIDYGGTYKSFPTLEADFYSEADVKDDGTAGTLTGNGDCGYVAFFNENKKIIQLGDPDEPDAQGYAKSQTLANQSFTSILGWSAAAQALWTTNGGRVVGSPAQEGAVDIGVASYLEAENPDTSGTLLSVQSKAEAPYINYKLVAKATGRTATTVNVKVTITAALAGAKNYFGTRRGLEGSVYIGGDWYDVTIKAESANWKGNGAHTVNISAVVDGLDATTTSLTGIKFKVTRTDDLGKTGVLAETACNNLTISKYTAPVADTYYLTPSNYGSSVGKWHGPTIMRTLPADAAGETGAVNFTFTYKQKMGVGNDSSAAQQLGAFQAQITGANGAIIAGVRIAKAHVGTNAAGLYFYVNGSCVYSAAKSIELSYNRAVRTSTITKTGSSVTFNIAGVVRTFTNSAISTVKATHVTIMFEQYSAYDPLKYNGLYWLKFVKNNCDTWRDVPNKFSANDTVEADCKNAEIRLNGIESPSLGALGNDWEGFFLSPGLNQIGFSYSDWVTDAHAPKVKVRYREVFL